MGTAVTCVMAIGVSCLLVGCMGWLHAPLAGRATLSSGTADPCRGVTFDADDADPRCLHHGTGVESPAPSGLQIALASARAGEGESTLHEASSSPLVAKSGYDARLVVELKNTSHEPLPVDLDDSCGTFEAQASNESANSFESDCFGACGNGPEPHVFSVTLEPGGIVRKKVKFYAVQRRVIMDEHQECVTRTLGSLPPGEYQLRVTLPWTDPVPDDPTVMRPRVVEAPLTITP
jgi:hypothetical protein